MLLRNRVKKKDERGNFYMKKFFTKKRIILLICIVAAIVLISVGVVSAVKGLGDKKEVDNGYAEAGVQRDSIVKTIEASGVIEPYERYEITSLVRGEIVAAPFEEGDYVNKDDMLYKIDDEDARISIEKTTNSIEKAEISRQNTLDDISKLNIYAPASGLLGDLKLKESAQAATGEVATITNTDELKVKIPFLASEFDKIAVGNSVTLASASYMTSFEGRVSYKFFANESAALDGSNVRNVEITIPNPGALGIGATVSATVHTNGGDVQSASSGTIETGDVTSVISDVSGTVKTLNVKEGDYVTKGQLIAVLENENLINNKRTNEIDMADNQLSLQSNIKNLENYTITSPISGTVITKNSKTGDNIDSTNSQTVMMVVADMSRVKFSISVDELDISDIQVGQTAIVDADAISNKTFNGVVSNIASEGVSTGDGVTTYSVEITIDEPGELRSGMNVNANIVVAQADNVLVIPEEALSNSDGETARVLVKSLNESENSENKGDRGKRNSDDSQKPNGDMPQSPNGDMPKDGVPNGESPQGGDSNGNMQQPPEGNGGTPERTGGNSAIPEGYVLREIQLGISDGTNVEVKSGLSEGDIVAYIPTTASETDSFMMMMGPGGGGGIPGGGGGAPGGGGGGRNGGGGGGGRNGGGGGPR